jgi:dTDP-4-dehydrorhamnose reductase
LARFAKKILDTAGVKDVAVIPIRTDEWPTPTRRPKFSVLRHYRMELLGRDSARPWEDAVAEFVKEWTTAKQ